MKKIYIKSKGYNEFYECSIETRMTGSGYKVARIEQADKISKAAYYKQDESKRFIFPYAVEAGSEIHEIGNHSFFDKLEA